MEVLNISVQSILHIRAFFDDLRALAFILYPVKLVISTLESQDYSLADCFVGLARLEAAIKNLSKNDHCTFVNTQYFQLFHNLANCPVQL